MYFIPQEIMQKMATIWSSEVHETRTVFKMCSSVERSNLLPSKNEFIFPSVHVMPILEGQAVLLEEKQYCLSFISRISRQSRFLWSRICFVYLTCP